MDLKVLKMIYELGLLFKRQKAKENPVTGYVDSDYAGSLDTRKSLTGFVFTLFGITASWKATLQSVIALSMTEAEYIAVSEAMKEAMWMKGILSELGIH